MKFQPLNTQTSIPYPAYAGVVVACTFSTLIPEGLTTNDIVEIGVLPQGCSLVDAKLITDNIGITADVGFIPETKGNKSCGDEFFEAADMTALSVTHLDKPDALRSGTTGKERSIGLKIKSGTSTSGLLTFILSYNA